MTAGNTPPPNDRIEAIQRSDLPPVLWWHTTRFHHGQCDPAGIVYTPEFFNVSNHAIEAWFSGALGLDYYDIIGRQRTGLGYVTAAATFFLPCMMGEEIDIFVAVDRVGKRSYSLTLYGIRETREVYRGRFTTVTTTLDGHAPIDIPEPLRTALVAYEARTSALPQPA